MKAITSKITESVINNPSPSGCPDLTSLLDQIDSAKFMISYAESSFWPANRQLIPHEHDQIYHLEYFWGRGFATIGTEQYTLSGRTIFLIPPHTTHSFQAMNGQQHSGLRNLGIKFSIKGISPLSLPKIIMHPETLYFHQRLKSSMQLIVEEWQTERIGSSTIMSNTMSTLLTDIVRSWHDEAKRTSQPRLILELCRYLATHYAEVLSISRLADYFSVRPDSLCRQFKKELGVSPGVYLTRLRLKQACILLRSGYSVTQAAEKTGFTSIHYFSRVFKKNLGASPVDWLERTYGETIIKFEK
jgi:AraC-like DNA-binding protein